MMIPTFGIRSIGAALVVLLLLSATTELRAAEPARHLVLLPPRVELSSTEARQLLVAQWQAGEQYSEQATQGVEFTSSDDTVVKIDAGIAIPVGNGSATI